jgi:hypothetical protein
MSGTARLTARRDTVGVRDVRGGNSGTLCKESKVIAKVSRKHKSPPTLSTLVASAPDGVA